MYTPRRRASSVTDPLPLRLSLLVAVLLLAACRFPFSGGSGSTPIPPTATSRTALSSPPAAGGAGGPLAIATTVPSPTPLPAGTPVVLRSVAPRSTPKPSGEQALTLPGGSDDPATLDPALVADEGEAFLVRQLFRGLVSLRNDLSVAPDLAETVEITADRKSYTFRLLDGLTFQGGQALSAEDVKYSLERALDPSLARATGSALPAATYLAAIAGAPDRLAGRVEGLSGVQVIDRQTVRIELTRPDQNFLQALALPAAVVVNRANVARGAGWWRTPDGSGPFALDQWTPGERIVLRGFTAYRPQPPTLRTVTLLLGAAAASPTTLYERDKLDLAPVAETEVARYLSPGVPMQGELHRTEMLAATYVFLNARLPPFDDPALRRALILGFPRDKIPTVTANGYARPMTALVPVDDAAWRVDLPSYDLPGARSLLTQTGAATAGLTFYTGGDWTPVAMAQVYRRDLGLQSEVVALERGDFAQQLAARTLVAFSLTWIADLPDPGSMLVGLFHSGSPNNPIGYANHSVDRLLTEAAVEPDTARRARLYREAQRLIVADNVVIPVSRPISYDLIKPWVHELTRSPLGMLGLEAVWVSR